MFRLVGKCLSYDGFAHRDVKCTDEVLSDKCTLFRTKVDLIDIPKVVKTMINFSGADDNSQIAKANFDDQSVPTISVELVGDRFLRRMVRILVVS